jgi:hypothetical protein
MFRGANLQPLAACEQSEWRKSKEGKDISGGSSAISSCNIGAYTTNNSKVKGKTARANGLVNNCREVPASPG